MSGNHMNITTNKLHNEDIKTMIKFIDYVRLERSKPINARLEILARHCAEYIGINPDQPNARLANRFDQALEGGRIR